MRNLTSFCIVAVLGGCGLGDEALSVSTGALANTDRLAAGESLFPNQAISSGSTSLVYQGDNNLVLYQGGSPIWASMAALGAGANQFAMQTDCNAVVYTTGGPVWASGTNGHGSSCTARVIAGDWFICSGSTRVFSARGGGDCGGGGGGGGGGAAYAGCFSDDPSRALPAHQPGGFSIQACNDRCRSAGFAFSGSQWFDQCFCGNAPGFSRVGDGECNTPCNAGGGFCGGAWRNSIYATGVSGGGGEQFVLSQMARIGGNGDPVAAYLIHMFKNTEIHVLGITRTLWDMIDKNKFMVALGNNGAGTDSYRVFFHYTSQGHSMIATAQHQGFIRYRNSSNGSVTHWFGFTQGGIFDPTLAHANMDHAYKSLFEESGKDLCLQPQWNDHSTVGEIDIDFHRQLEVVDHARPDNSDPLTTSSGGGKNNNATFLNAWGAPAGLPGYSGPMTVSNGDRGLIYDFHGQRAMPGFAEVATVLGGRGIGVVTGTAVPR
jgi:hypothetical protein